MLLQEAAATGVGRRRLRLLRLLPPRTSVKCLVVFIWYCQAWGAAQRLHKVNIPILSNLKFFKSDSFIRSYNEGMDLAPGRFCSLEWIGTYHCVSKLVHFETKLDDWKYQSMIKWESVATFRFTVSVHPHNNWPPIIQRNKKCSQTTVKP